ncbi:hypothetical protein EV702DRAFT_1198049 [Suillus placidus]|uniref:Fungal-type protein kinase domain-containing protein n=1 Tax=Suillus placidus TaxID=48579 RepID=A0A9P6ZTX1_9AGAM|nr:hypothetical protein EV702DRAFT_1198049 [Suillus placidus]
MFRTLKEFVRALRDIVKIQQVVVEERQILHRDCSLNNAMILDDLEGSEGFLIDWEFAVHIAKDNKYPIGGTGTVPFMSRGLLNQVAVLQQQLDLESQKKKKTRARKSVDKPKNPKSSSDSLALPVSCVIQGYADDLESLFSSLLGFASSSVVPTITFFASPADEKRLVDEFHPYFKDLIPLAIEWRRALVDNMVHPVTFTTILALLNSHLDRLPDNEELISAVKMLKNDAVILADRVKGKQIASESFSLVESKRQKSNHDSVSNIDHARGKWIASEPSSVVAPKRQKSHHSDTKSNSASGSDT